MNKLSNAALGALLEKHTARLLRATLPDCNVKRNRYGIDIEIVNTVTGLKIGIEVKASNKHPDNRYRACIDKKKHTNLHGADFIIFWTIDGLIAQAYIIPSSVIEGKQSLTISPNGKYAQYRAQGSILVA